MATQCCVASMRARVCVCVSAWVLTVNTFTLAAPHTFAQVECNKLCTHVVAALLLLLLVFLLGQIVM